MKMSENRRNAEKLITNEKNSREIGDEELKAGAASGLHELYMFSLIS